MDSFPWCPKKNISLVNGVSSLCVDRNCSDCDVNASIGYRGVCYVRDGNCARFATNGLCEQCKVGYVLGNYQCYGGQQRVYAYYEPRCVAWLKGVCAECEKGYVLVGGFRCGRANSGGTSGGLGLLVAVYSLIEKQCISIRSPVVCFLCNLNAGFNLLNLTNFLLIFTIWCCFAQTWIKFRVRKTHQILKILQVQIGQHEAVKRLSIPIWMRSRKNQNFDFIQKYIFNC